MIDAAGNGLWFGHGLAGECSPELRPLVGCGGVEVVGEGGQPRPEVRTEYDCAGP